MEPAAASPTLADLDVGARLGRGASANVCLATHGTARYAIKIVDKENIVGQAQLTRLFREKELLSTLRHPGIVALHATFKDDSRLYFLLELCTGGELLWHMRRERACRVAPAAARLTLGALLLPLRFMEESGVLYRDLKPTNVLFTSVGRLKLVDFGHAKRVATMSERSTSVCGTPHYHAPETVRGEGHALPAQLWALGVLLVEMLAGRAPFWDAAGLPPLPEQILAAEPELGPLPDDGAQALAQSLLQPDAEVRAATFAGAARGDEPHAGHYAGMMAHPWLASLDWSAIERGEAVPAFDFAQHAATLVEPEAAASSAELDALSAAFDDF